MYQKGNKGQITFLALFRQKIIEEKFKPDFDPHKHCIMTRNDCWPDDMNLICVESKCQCRKNLQWNAELRECRLFMVIQ